MIDFMSQSDEYCERLSAEFFAEPLNFFSNLFFWLAAWLAYREWRRRRIPETLAFQGLIALLFLVGLGSGFYHGFASYWAQLCDIGFIGLFVLWFLWFWLRQILLMTGAKALGVFAGFFILSGMLQMIFKDLPVNGSQGYFGVEIFLLGLGFQQMKYLSGSKTLLTAGLVFLVSLIFRTMDELVCEMWPLGTHFLWHSLNALVCYLAIRGFREEIKRKAEL